MKFYEEKLNALEQFLSILYFSLFSFIKSRSIRWYALQNIEISLFIRPLSYNSYYGGTPCTLSSQLHHCPVTNYRHLCATQKHQKPILLRIQMQNVFLKLTAKERNRREEKEGCFEKVSKRVMDRRNDGGCVRETRKLVRRISRRNEAARGGAKYRAIDFTARRLAR